jgi:DNA-binding transcriptional MerR regulator
MVALLAGMTAVARTIRARRTGTGYRTCAERDLEQLRFIRRTKSLGLRLDGITLVLLFIGIRNAWDSATYAAVGRSPPQDEHESQHRPAE